LKFNTLIYLIFLAAAVTAYYLIPHRVRKPFLLIVSYIFYCSWYPPYGLLLAGTTVFCYLAAKNLAHGGNRAFWLMVGIGGSILSVCIFKYTNLFLQSIGVLGLELGIVERIPVLDVALPLGISFFTFSALSHVIDVSRGEKQEISFLDFAVFLSFWPHLIAGPILRVPQLIPQINRRALFSWTNIRDGIILVFNGLFLKTVLADSIADLVDHGYAMPTASLAPIDTVALAMGFGFQIYFDFAGYSSIAIGSAKMLGITFPQNFNFPYASSDPQEFWRRWHMTLSVWFRDYVYIPLGGNRVSTLRSYFNVLVTMTLCGLWHGANWTFVVWGFFHGCLMISHRLLKKISGSLHLTGLLPEFLTSAAGVALTYCLVSIGWIFFRSSSLQQAWETISALTRFDKGLLKHNIPGELHEMVALYLFLFWSAVAIRRLVQLKYSGWDRLNERIGLGWALLVNAGIAALFIYVLAFMRNQNAFIYFQF
jgi:alginate O-acetyltransferase complex protein AlgI